MKVLIATNNSHKADEIRNAIDFPGWEFVTLREAGVESDPVEDAGTFVGNARIKALAAHEASGGMCADGDDAANNALLLANLADTPDFLRTARFSCTLVFIGEDGAETVARGKVEGRIGYEERGDEGFGYDPLFFPIELGGQTTFAEVPQERKSAISHRGRALAELKEKLKVVYNPA